MKAVDRMLIFDVDGVITNLQKKEITEPEILDEIITRLVLGEPIAFNTGRSIKWIKDRVLSPLIEKVKDIKILQNLLAVGEKGGTWTEFDDQSNLIENKDDDISMPDYLKNEIRNLIKNKYSECMFYDESKLTMISTEMSDGHSLKDYRRKQKMFLAEAQTLLTDKNLAAKIKIDPTTIGADIENIFVGKDFAVKKIIEWIKKKGISPQKYIAFGDSFKSDVPMVQELNSRGLPVEFIYVGKEDINPSAFPFTIYQTQAQFEKGTLDFLKEQA